MTSLKETRLKIDKIDTEILRLLRSRKKLVISAKKLKAKSKKPIEDKKREKEVLSEAKDPYETAILKKIVSESKKVQHRL